MELNSESAPEKNDAPEKAPETPQLEIALVTKACLWMLCNHFEFAVQRGAFTTISTEEQFEVLKNLLIAKQSLGGWTPPKEPKR